MWKNASIEYKGSHLKVDGEEKKVNFLEVKLDDRFLLRTVNEEDLEGFVALKDPSLAEQFSLEDKEGETNLNTIVKRGYTFGEEKGLVGFVAIDEDTGERVARAYLKTWGTPLAKPKFKLMNDGGVEVVDGTLLTPNGSRLVELGGWITKEGYRGKGLAQALTHLSAEAIYQLQKAGEGADYAFIANVGPLRPADNAPLCVDYRMRLTNAIRNNGFEFDAFADLAGQGQVLSEAQFKEVFRDLKTERKVGGRVENRDYRFGDPRRETGPAYHIAGKLANEDYPLIVFMKDGRRQGEFSPILFDTSNRMMHPEHGGSYTVAALRESKKSSA